MSAAISKRHLLRQLSTTGRCCSHPEPSSGQWTLHTRGCVCWRGCQHPQAAVWGRQRPCKWHLQGQPSRAFWWSCLRGVHSLGRLFVSAISMLCLASCHGYLCLYMHALLHTRTPYTFPCNLHPGGKVHGKHPHPHLSLCLSLKPHATSILKPACSCIPFPDFKVAGFCCMQLQPKLCIHKQSEFRAK